MLIKFFKNGQGGGAGPVDYLVEREVVAYDDNRNALRDSKGNVLMFEREPLPEVLHGDPDQMRHLIDACEHQWSYRAGVLSFTTEDAPTDDQQRDVIKRFEDLAFAGLEPDQTSILWVRHTHEERVELHFVTPRMELSTGRSLNIAPPGYQKPYDALRDVLNKQHQWNDPQAPDRAREVKSIIEDVKRGETREQIHDWILDRIEQGAIENRSGMVEALNDAGFDIPRQGKAYITVRDPKTDVRWRLKGDIFRESWTRENTASRALERASPEHDKASARGRETGNNREPNRTTSRSGSRLDALELGTLRDRLQEVTQKRADYNRGRYPIAAEYERTNGQEYAPDLSNGHTVQPNRHFDELRSQLVLGNQYGRDIPKSEPAATGFSDEPNQQQHNLAHLGREAPSTDHLSIWQLTTSMFGNYREEITYGNEQTQNSAITGRSFTDSTRTRIDQLRRTIDTSLQGINRAVQSLGDKIDRDDLRQASEHRNLSGLVNRVTGFIGIGLNHIREKLRYEREPATGANREREVSAGSFGIDEVTGTTRPALSRTSARSIIATPTSVSTTSIDQTLEPALAGIQKQSPERSR